MKQLIAGGAILAVLAAGCGDTSRSVASIAAADELQLAWDLASASDDFFVMPFDVRAQLRALKNAHFDLTATLMRGRSGCKQASHTAADAQDSHDAVVALTNDARRLERDLPYLRNDLARLHQDLRRPEIAPAGHARLLRAVNAALRQTAHLEAKRNLLLIGAHRREQITNSLARKAARACSGGS